MEDQKLVCSFCSRVGKNRNSAAQHAIRCKLNPAGRKLGGAHAGSSNANPFKGLTAASSVELREKAARLRARYAAGELTGSWKGRKHTEEERRKISEKMKGNRNANHRGDRQSYYKEIRMDSRWETAVAHHLDKLNVNWKYSERGFKLSDGRYYYPDFFLYKKNGEFSHLIEVKGYFREANKAKFAQFRRDYPEIHIEVWFQDKLFKLGLLTCDGYSRVDR